MKSKNGTRTICALTAAAIFTSGCATVPLTKDEKKWRTAFYAAQLADLGTTYYGLHHMDDHLLEESNPMWGKNPSLLDLALIKGSAIGIIELLSIISPKSRKFLYKFGTALGSGAALWNLYQIADKNDKKGNLNINMTQRKPFKKPEGNVSMGNPQYNPGFQRNYSR